MTKSLTVYRVVIVDKENEELIFDGHSMASDQSVALANVVVKNAKAIEGKEIHTYVSSITSFSKEV